MLMLVLILSILFGTYLVRCEQIQDSQERPHIIFILSDDLGFNDVGFHGSSQISTPNIDALAYSGLILNRYYVNPICTPSRSALMTGKYPIHTGMQHTVLYAAEPRGLPLAEKLLPQYLNEMGYQSHIAGKWHLGHFKREYTPLFRGFRSHLGFWTGHHDYYDHTSVESSEWGLDMRSGLNVTYDYHGQYTTDIVTNEALRIIKVHNASQPLFLYVAHAAVHSGNSYNPLAAPDHIVAKMGHIGNYKRRRYAAMVSQLDGSVGKIVQELMRQSMLQKSIIVFSTDNGGPAEGFNLNHASNWPLRGVKNTLWEGGVRGVGVLWSPRLQQPSRVAMQMMHIVDWLPTLLSAAGANELLLKNLTQLDGLNLWTALSKNEESPRKTILHNIDDIWGSAAITVENWKLVKGTNYKGAWDGWYGPPGIRESYNYDDQEVVQSMAGKAINSLKLMPTVPKFHRLRAVATVECNTNHNYLKQGVVCMPLLAPCIFNVRDDPCEQHNMAKIYPNILKNLLNEMMRQNSTALPAGNKPLDPRANPRYWNWTWTNFGDYENTENINIGT